MNRCSPRRSIHKCKLSKIISSFISFQISLTSINKFRTIIRTSTYNIKFKTFVSLVNNFLFSLCFLDRHWINYNIHIFVSQITKQYRFFKQISNISFSLFRFLYDLWHKLLFFIKNSICFSAYSLATYFFLLFILLHLLLKLFICFLLVRIALLRVS